MHVIRLRHPWQKRHVDSESSYCVDVPETIDAESIAANPPDDKTFQYQRPFNLPTGLDAGTRIYLRVTQWSGKLDSIMINDEPIQITTDSIFADISDRLQTRNLLQIQLSSTADQLPGLTGSVTIEID